MRARLPDRADVVERDGVRVGFEIYGRREPALLLVPSSPITHSRCWKMIAPTLARRYTVATVDNRGSGRSDRPCAPDAWTPAVLAADLLAVLDAAGLDTAVLVAHCHAVPWILRVAVEHPERVAGLVAIAPELAVAPPHPHWAVGDHWADEVGAGSGWATFNRSFWRQDSGYRAWIEFFFGQQLPEPHSTKLYEDMVTWATRDTDLESMILQEESGGPAADEADAWCRGLHCPVLVLHGSEDLCQPVARGRRMAELTGGELVVLDGAGHLPHARDPVRLNLLIKQFVDRVGR